MQPNYYDFNVRFPIYETNILNLTNVKHPDADFSLHENLERMILETGDEMKKSTNVKADMTNWTMHKTHTGFKQLADMVMSIAGQLTKTKPPLYTSECWGAVYGEGEETKVHSHWNFIFGVGVTMSKHQRVQVRLCFQKQNQLYVLNQMRVT